MSTPEFYDRSIVFGKVVGAKGGPALRVAIAINPAVANNAVAQLIAAAVCNLLPRITERYTNVDVLVPESQDVKIPRVSPSKLETYLLKTLEDACPKGKFGSAHDSSEPYDYCITIGNTPAINSKTTIFAWASGWRCFLSATELSFIDPSRKLNPFSCLATASLAVMELYYMAENLVVRHDSLGIFDHSSEINGWSLLDYSLSTDDGPDLPNSLQVGKVVQAGLGGTGEALLWALRHGPDLIGEWRGYEHEDLDLSNGNRYSLMVASATGPKAALAQEAFGSVHSRLNFEVVPRRIEGDCSGLLDATLVLATVDDPQIRVTLQRLGAQLILNVGTNTQWLSISRHELKLIREGGPCVGCFYGSTEQAPRRSRESTVSFVVALVGALLGAELMKSYLHADHCLGNSWVANIFAPTAAQVILRAPTPDCDTCAVIRA